MPSFKEKIPQLEKKVKQNKIEQDNKKETKNREKEKSPDSFKTKLEAQADQLLKRLEELLKKLPQKKDLVQDLRAEAIQAKEKLDRELNFYQENQPKLVVKEKLQNELEAKKEFFDRASEKQRKTLRREIENLEKELDKLKDIPKAPVDLKGAQEIVQEVEEKLEKGVEKSEEKEKEPDREELKKLRQDYIEQEVKMNKNYSGVSGWMKRMMSKEKFSADKSKLKELEKAYEGELAEQVFQEVDKMLEEEDKLVSERAKQLKERKEKSTVTKLMNVWNTKTFKKIRQAKLYVGLGAGTIGLLAGAPIVGALGGGAIAYKILGRSMGATGGFIGSYNLMSKVAKKKGTDVELTTEQKRELKEYANELNLTWWAKKRNKKIKIEGEEVRAGDVYESKKLELETQQAEKMTDEKLEEVIDYYQTAITVDGKDPNNDEKYRMLRREYAKRLRAQQKVAETGEKEKPKKKEKQDLEKFKEKVDKKVEALHELYRESLLNYLKQHLLVSRKYFQQMKEAGKYDESGQESEEYIKWNYKKNELKKIYDSFPEHIKSFIDAQVEGSDQPT